MADFKDKISNLINSQVPDFVLEDHPLFLDFVKAYYQLMESAEIKLTNIGDPDVIKLEGSAGGSIQLDGTNVSDDDDGDNILLEATSYGDFINGETITGATSRATATILIEDVDDGARLFVTHNNKFIDGELITGSSSAAEASISQYRANPVQNLQQLLDYADVDKTLASFLLKFRNSFLTSIPDRLHDQINKRKLIKNIKTLYQSKGTKRASEIFFKLLFNEAAEIKYPKDEMLSQWKSGKFDHLSFYENKKPHFDEAIGAYTLDFDGRVTMASSKNYLLVSSHSLDDVYVRFGRVENREFTMDVRYPCSPLQALGISIASIITKTTG